MIFPISAVLLGFGFSAVGVGWQPIENENRKEAVLVRGLYTSDMKCWKSEGTKGKTEM